MWLNCYKWLVNGFYYYLYLSWVGSFFKYTNKLRYLDSQNQLTGRDGNEDQNDAKGFFDASLSLHLSRSPVQYLKIEPAAEAGIH